MAQDNNNPQNNLNTLSTFSQRVRAAGNLNPNTPKEVASQDATNALNAWQDQFAAKNAEVRNNMQEKTNLDNEQKALNQVKEQVDIASNPDATIGEQKQINLKHNNTVDGLAQKGQDKMMSINGMSNEDTAIANMTSEEYIASVNATDPRSVSEAEFRHTRATQAKNRALSQEPDTSTNLYDAREDTIKNSLVALGSSTFNLGSDAVNAPLRAYRRNLTEGINESTIQFAKTIKEKRDAGLVLNEDESDFLKLKSPDGENSVYDVSIKASNLDRFMGNVSREGNRYAKYIDQSAVEEVSEEFRNDYKKFEAGEIDGWDLVGGTISTALSNPSVLTQVTAESIPYIAASMLSLPATVAIGAEANYVEIKEDFIKNNDGVDPTIEEAKELYGLSVLASGVDVAGDRLLGSAFKGTGATKGLKKVTAKLGTSFAANALRKVGATGINAGGEYLAEGGSDAIVQIAKDAKNEGIDLAESHVAGSLGAGSGGGISIVSEGSGLIKDAAKSINEQIQEGQIEAQKSFDKAQKTINKLKSEFSYDSVIKDNDIDKLPKESDSNFDNVKDSKTKLAIANNKVIEASKTNDKKLISSAKEGKAVELKKIQDKIDFNMDKVLNSKITTEEAAKLVKENIELDDIVNNINENTVDIENEAKDLSNQSETVKVKGSSNRVNNLINSLKSAPSAIEAGSIKAVFNNKNLNLSKEQKKELSNAYKQAKTFDTVSEEFVNGGIIDGQQRLGLSNYSSNNNKYVRTGNKAKAISELNDLKSWRDIQSEKINRGTWVNRAGNTVPHTEAALVQFKVELSAMNNLIKSIESNNSKIDGIPSIDTSSVNNESAQSINPQNEVNPIEEATVSVDNVEEVQGIETNIDTTTPEVSEATQTEEANATDVQSEAVETDFNTSTENELSNEEVINLSDEELEAKYGVKYTVSRKENKKNLNKLTRSLVKDAGISKEDAKVLTDVVNLEVKKGNNAEQIKETIESTLTGSNATKVPNINKAVQVYINQSVNSDFATRSGKSLANQLTQDTDANINNYENALVEAKEVSNKEYKNTKGKNGKVVSAARHKDNALRAVHRKYDWLKTYFNAGNKTNILQNTKDLFTDINSLPVKVSKYLDRKLTNEDIDLLNNYDSFRKTMSDALDKTDLDVKGTQGKDAKLTSLFLNENGKLDENTKDAIIASMYNYLATNANESTYVSLDRMRDILELQDDAPVPNHLVDIMKDQGINPDLVIESIGGDVLSNLNIVTNEKTPDNLNDNMIGTFGILALDLFEKTGYMSKKKYNESDENAIREFLGKEKMSKGDNSMFSTNIRITTKKDTETGRDVPSDEITSIINSMKSSNKSKPLKSVSMWEGMFGNMTFVKSPSFTVPTEVATTVKNTNKKVPKEKRDALETHQKRKHFVRNDMVDIIDVIGEDATLTIMGKKDPSNLHISERESQELKNESLKRSFENFFDFHGSMEEHGLTDSPFYFTHSVWKNGRFGINETLVNPQSDKFHRSLIHQEGWVNTLNLSEDATKEEKEMTQIFWLGLDETLGLKSESDLDNSPKHAGTRKALDTLMRVRSGENVDSFEIQDMAEFLRDEEGAMSFDALNQVANFKEAKLRGDATVEVNLGIELDGKTNGVIIAILQYAAEQNIEETFKSLQKGGVFANYSDYTNVKDFLADNKDAYQEVGALIAAELANPESVINSEENLRRPKFAQITPEKIRVSNKIFDLTNLKFLRNLSKPVVMTTNYGAGISLIMEEFQTKFVTELYGKIQGISVRMNEADFKYREAKKSGDKVSMILWESAGLEVKRESDVLKKDIQVMTGSTVSFDKVNPRQYSEVLFTPKELNAINNLVSNLYKTPVKKTVDGIYGKLSEGRSAVTDSVDIMNRLYSVLRNTMIEEKTEELRNEGRIIIGTMGLPQSELDKIESKLKGVKPQMLNSVNTVLNKDGSFNPDYTSELTKLEANRSAKDTDGAYTIKPEFSKKGFSYTKGMSQVADTGVGPGVTSIHELDAIVMGMVYNSGMDTLGVHDANYMSVKDISENGSIQNQAFLEAMDDNNIAVNTKKVLDRSINDFNKIAKELDYNPEVLLKEVTDQLATPETNNSEAKDGNVVYNERLTALNSLIDDVAETKDGVLKYDGGIYVDQYSFGTDHSSLKVEGSSVYTNEESASKAMKNNPKEVFSDHFNDVKGSNINDELNPEDYSTTTKVDMTNTTEVFDNLPIAESKKENEGHKTILRQLVGDMATKLTQPFNLYMREQTEVDSYGLATSTDIYITNLIQGSKPTSGVLSQGVKMSTHEIYAHELSHLVYQEGLEKSSISKGAVSRMFNAAKSKLDYTAFIADVDNATQQEIDNAKETYEYVFNNSKGDHLDEFAAFGLTNEAFGNALNNVDVRPTKIFSGSAYEQLVNVIAYLVDLFSGRITNKNTNNKEYLVKMLDNMLKVNASKEQGIVTAAAKVISLPAKGVEYMLSPLEYFTKKLANTDWVSKNKSSSVRLIGDYVKNPSKYDNVSDTLYGHLNSVRRVMGDQKESIASSLIDETFGRTHSNKRIIEADRMKNQTVDVARKQVKTAMHNNLDESFSETPTDAELESITKVLIKLDVASLIESGKYSLAEVIDIIANEETLDAEINNLERVISTYLHSKDYIAQADNLGYFMVTGMTKNNMTMTNAHNIANGYFNKNIKINESVANKVEPLIDMLATLKGLKYSDPIQKGSIVDLSNREINGVENVINTHSSIKISGRSAFGSDKEYKVLAMKGYTKEDYREDIDVVYATKAEHNDLIAKGYIIKSETPIKRDVTDPLYGNKDADLYVYVSPNGSMSTYMQGAFSTTNNTSKGTDLAEVNYQANAKDAYIKADENVSVMLDLKLANPSNSVGNHMVPIISPVTGQVVNFRYMMNENTKDTLLGKDNNAFRVLSGMAASTVDKVESKNSNNKLVSELKKAYDEDSIKDSRDYITVGAYSEDAKAKEAYNMLPDETKRAIKEIWGKNGLRVRKENFNMIFGYRKQGLADMFAKDPESRNIFEKTTVEVLSKLLGDKAARRVTQAQNFMEGLIREVKDIIVVRSVVVTLNNMVSNTLVLVMNGVPINKAVKYQYDAFVGGNALIREVSQKRSLELKLGSEKNPSKIKRIQAEIAKIDKSMKGNPAYVTYSQGLMPNIVDDVAADVDLGKSGRSKVQKNLSVALDTGLKYVPSFGRDLVKGLFGLPDSNTYKTLNNLVMQTDFMARHALLQNKIDMAGKEVDNNALTEFVGEAEEIFVNFNLPTHRSIQLLNDIGLAWFTKYNIRVVKSALAMIKNNPKKVVSTIFTGDLLGVDAVNSSTIGSLAGVPLVETLDNPASRAVGAIGLIPAVNVIN